MSQRNIIIVIGVLVLMGITSAVSILAYNYLLGGNGEPNTPITAPTLSLATSTSDSLQSQVEALSTQVAQLQAQNATLVAGGAALTTSDPTSEAANATSETASESTPATAANAPTATLFRISQDESKVSFTLTEILLGKPNTVVGITNQVAGDILVDFNTPVNSRVGVIRVDARNLTTDSEMRNRTLRTSILESNRDEYQYVEFTPTAIISLPDKIAIGQPVTFQITGDLKVRDITQSVPFEVTLTAASGDRLEGSAKAQVTRDQFNLQIPNVPSVSDVSSEVQLEIDFVATKVSE